MTHACQNRFVQTDDEILEFARNYGATIFHPSGTCKMAPDSDPMGVVDTRLRVRGLSGLRVIDCSVMPRWFPATPIRPWS